MFMKKPLILSLLYVLFAGECICQTTFIRTYSGFPGFSSIKKCSDKGYIIAGTAYGSSTDAAIYKADSLGHMLWQRRIGQWNYEGYNYAEETHDGGYIAIGYNGVPGPSNPNIMLTKFTNYGSLSWNKSIGLSGSSSRGLMVHEDADHGFTVAGQNSFSFPNYIARCFLLKTDSVGQVIWGKLFQLPFDVGFAGACRTTDGGYVYLAWDQIHSPGFNIILLKADSAGNFLWAKTIGGSGDEYSYGITPTNHNGVMLAGGTNGYNCDSTDLLLISVDSSGTIIWAKTYGAPGEDVARSVLQTNDGGFILSGALGQGGAANNNKGFALKTNASGFIYWSKTYITGNQYPTSIIEQADDGGYAVAGAVSFNLPGSASLIKTDASGNSCDDSTIIFWSQSISIPSADLPVTIDTGGTSIPVNLPPVSFSGEYLLCMHSVEVPAVEIPNKIISVYPLPSFDGRFTFELPYTIKNGTIDLFNSRGQKVRSLSLSKSVDISDLPRGVYHYSILFGQTGQRFGGTMVYR
jgi:hypothetical protein